MTTTRYFIGDVVHTADHWHSTGTLRPHFVIKVMGDGRLWVVPLSHTPQGQWRTDELGGGSYIGPQDFRTGRRADFILDPTVQTCELSQRRLSEYAINGALAEIRRVLQALEARTVRR